MRLDKESNRGPSGPVNGCSNNFATPAPYWWSNKVVFPSVNTGCVPLEEQRFSLHSRLFSILLIIKFISSSQLSHYYAPDQDRKCVFFFFFFFFFCFSKLLFEIVSFVLIHWILEQNAASVSNNYYTTTAEPGPGQLWHAGTAACYSRCGGQVQRKGRGLHGLDPAVLRHCKHRCRHSSSGPVVIPGIPGLRVVGGPHGKKES